MKPIKQLLAGAAALAAGIFTASAQVDNYALEFSADPAAVVNLGQVARLTSPTSYTLQFWVCPTAWNQGASLLRAGTFSVKLGNEHALIFNDGANHMTVTSSLMGKGKWTQVTLRSSSAGTTVTLNNSAEFTSASALTLPASEKSLWLGGDFAGRIDEVRLWNGQLPTDYDSFWANTLNQYNPSWNSLAAYWKMDQELCPNLVDYRGTAHGTLAPAGVSKVKVTDNEAFKYRITLGYGNIERFFDRQIARNQYSISNYISIISATLTPSTGHAAFVLPRADAQFASGASRATDSSRGGVLDCAGVGATADGSVLSAAPTAYTFEAWVKPTATSAGAVLFAKGDAFKVTLGNNNALSVSVNGSTVTTSSRISNNSWTHVGVAVSGTAVTVAVNGSAVSTSGSISE